MCMTEAKRECVYYEQDRKKDIDRKRERESEVLEAESERVGQ